LVGFTFSYSFFGWATPIRLSLPGVVSSAVLILPFLPSPSPRLTWTLLNSAATAGLEAQDPDLPHVVAPPRFIAPFERPHPSVLRRFAEMSPTTEEMRRRVFTSGADQVLARPPPTLNVMVSCLARVESQ
jgi:hypothetical protein